MTLSEGELASRLQPPLQPTHTLSLLLPLEITETIFAALQCTADENVTFLLAPAPLNFFRCLADRKSWSSSSLSVCTRANFDRSALHVHSVWRTRIRMRMRKRHLELWSCSCSVSFRFVLFHRFRSEFYSLLVTLAYVLS